MIRYNLPNEPLIQGRKECKQELQLEHTETQKMNCTVYGIIGGHTGQK